MTTYTGLNIPESALKSFDTFIMKGSYEKVKFPLAFPERRQFPTRVFKASKTNPITESPQKVQRKRDITRRANLTVTTTEYPIPQLGIGYNIAEEDLRESVNYGYQDLFSLTQDEALSSFYNQADICMFSTWDSAITWYDTESTAPGLYNYANTTPVNTISSNDERYSGTGTGVTNTTATADFIAAIKALRAQKVQIYGNTITIVGTPQTILSLAGLSDYDHPNINLIDKIANGYGLKVRWVDTPYLLGTTAETTGNGSLFFVPPEAGAYIAEYGGFSSVSKYDPHDYELNFTLTYGGTLYIPRPEKVIYIKSIYY